VFLPLIKTVIQLVKLVLLRKEFQELVRAIKGLEAGFLARIQT
jgi:hypothetical protein